MKYCTQCGTQTEKNERFCLVCGAEIPDLDERIPDEGFNRWWLLPIIMLSIILAGGIIMHFYLEHQNSETINAFESGIQHAEEGHYTQALEAFEEAVSLKSNFQAAKTAKEFMEVALTVESKIQSIDKLIEEQKFHEGLQLAQEAEDQLESYKGEVTQRLLDRIISKRNEVQIAQIEQQFSESPSFEELKILLWQIHSINAEKSEELVQAMEDRFINDTFSRASENLQDNQFTTALNIVEEGLRYLPESERLKNLKSTIEKQKVAFETEQQKRIEQALSQYELEQDHNKNNAVEVVKVTAKPDEYGDIVVKGEIKSVATVPIQSVTVNYSLYDEEDELLTENETFLYPETLYPNETGKFEYIHYEMPDKVSIEINQISWFLDDE
ncbi:FxLYD domain-containing protein [Allobacillus sp. GCM10007491]|uniref:Zinc ribbon domain-containing protein n=1 Tax=Allobacillus saliphilus TaxID=2912308 RepID=A0A941CVM2_9BACI|nr:FxLYD domain-containing protein [Allobacillus saliphilus]MBR7553505.1 zinc ribbon domain-containing protein [Allobacillus saliphilus]